MSSILVVDDEEQIRRLICETLERAGYHVTEARDGKEARSNVWQINRRICSSSSTTRMDDIVHLGFGE